MLVVGAIEGHLNFTRRFWVHLGVIHRTEPTSLILPPLNFAPSKSDPLLIIYGLLRAAEVGIEMGLIVLLKVLVIRVRDSNIIKEPCTTEDKLFFPSGGLPQEFLGIVGENGKNYFIKSLC